MAQDPARRTPLTGLLIERIKQEGPLTFAAFMEACLYHPEHGYYTRPAQEGSDYFTSPDTGSLFGRLLARQLREMWEALGQPKKFTLMECGAGAGRLTAQILNAAVEQAHLFALALRAVVVERSPGRREQARAALAEFGDQVELAHRLPALPANGCVLSNELLDALPVRRVVQRGERLREIYVGTRGDELVEIEGEVSAPSPAAYLRKYGAPLEEGQFAEVNQAALDWLGGAAAALDRGFVLTIDYGYKARELYGPAHQRGTLMAYRQHRAHEDWLAWPGEQDLTAHVNFTALEERGSELGLETLGLRDQAGFLLALARAGEFRDMESAGSGEPEHIGARLSLRQLIHPEGMGERFKVLIQAKRVKGARLSGLDPL
ncbi:MAG: class I SAM-dependent methyltransferase [Candidatus Acidiferrales bacterium]